MRGLAALYAAFVAVLLLANSAGAGLRTVAGGNPAKPEPPGQAKKAEETSEQGSQPAQEHVPPGQAKKADEIAGQPSLPDRSDRKDAQPSSAPTGAQTDEQERSAAAEQSPPAQPQQREKHAQDARPQKESGTRRNGNSEPQKESDTRTTRNGNSAVAHAHVIICHRTGSQTNPYVVINISMSAWLHGHSTHPDLDGRSDILLKTGAAPGEKLPKSACGRPGTSNDPPGTPNDPPRQPPTTVSDPRPGNGSSAPGGSPGSAPASAPTTASAPTIRGETPDAKNGSGVAAQLGQTAVQGKLPFTGIPLWIAVLVGLALLGGGLALCSVGPEAQDLTSRSSAEARQGS